MRRPTRTFRPPSCRCLDFIAAAQASVCCPGPAAVLLAFAGQGIRFEVQPVVPTGAALVDGDAFGRMRSATHAAAVSPIIVSSRAVTTYTRPPSRRTG